MKVLKFISVILFLLLLFSFSGCKDKDKNLPVTENTVSSEVITDNMTDSSPEAKQSFFSKIKNKFKKQSVTENTVPAEVATDNTTDSSPEAKQSLFSKIKNKFKKQSVTENTVPAEVTTDNTTDSSPEAKQSFFSKIKENKIIFAIVIVLLLIGFIILIRFIICFFYDRDPYYPKGSVLKVNRGPYWHYGIYIGHNQVIHFAEHIFAFGITADIIQTSLEEFEKNDLIEIEKELYIEFPTTIICLTSCANRNITRGGTFEYLGKGEYGHVIVVSGHIKPRPKWKIVKTAKRALGKQKGKYNLFFKNCEHFANWCRYGLFYSSQVKNPVKTVKDASTRKFFEHIFNFMDFFGL